MGASGALYRLYRTPLRDECERIVEPGIMIGFGILAKLRFRRSGGYVSYYLGFVSRNLALVDYDICHSSSYSDLAAKFAELVGTSPFEPVDCSEGLVLNQDDQPEAGSLADLSYREAEEEVERSRGQLSWRNFNGEPRQAR